MNKNLKIKLPNTNCVFVASSEQNYELISNAIVKRDGYSNFVMEHKETFSEMINIASRANVFKELSEDSFEEKVN